MSPRQPSNSTFFSGGSPKVPRFGSSPASKNRPFTPGSTRDDLAQKRAAEAARQAQSLGRSTLAGSPLAGSGLRPPEEEPRTSFSDDMGRAFDDIGLAASKPLPPSEPPTPAKPHVTPEASNGARRAAADADAPPPGTAMLGARPPAEQKSGERGSGQLPVPPTDAPPTARQVSNPVKDVTTADLDGVPVFFIDGGLEGGLPDEHGVVSIKAQPDTRSVPLSPSHASQRASVQPDETSSTPRDGQQPLGAHQAAFQHSPTAQRSTPIPTFPPGVQGAMGDHTAPEGIYTAQQLSPSAEETHTSREAHDLSASAPAKLADRAERRTFGQPASSDPTSPHSFTSGTTPVAPTSPNAPSAQGDRGGYDPHIYGAAGAMGAAGVAGAAAAMLSSKLQGDVPDTQEIQNHDVHHNEEAGRGEAQNSATTADLAVPDRRNLTAEAPAEAPTIIPASPPYDGVAGTAHDAQSSTARQGPDAPIITPQRSHTAEMAAGMAAGTAGGAASVAIPDATVASYPERPSRPRAMSSVSAVPDDLDPDCLPDLTTAEPPISPPPREMAASPASVPDDYDACVPPQHLQHTNSMDHVPRTPEAGARRDDATDGHGHESTRDQVAPEHDDTPVAVNMEQMRDEPASHSFPEGTETAAQHSAPALAGGLAGAGLALGTGSSQMPEERSMSAASMVAIKDGRTGVPGAVRTSNLVCEPAPKTGETFMTGASATPSEVSLVGDTRRGHEAAESTASITAIRGGNEGAPPSPPGKSPLSASRTMDDMLDEAEPARLAGAGGAGALVAAGAVARDTPEDRRHGDSAEALRASQLHSTEAHGTQHVEPRSEHREAREIHSPTPRVDDWHTATTSTPANEVSATEADNRLVGEATPAPGDYMAAGSGETSATTPHAPGAFPVDPPSVPAEPVTHDAAPLHTETHADSLRERVHQEEATETPVAESSTMAAQPATATTFSMETPTPLGSGAAVAGGAAAAGAAAGGVAFAAGKAGASTDTNTNTAAAVRTNGTEAARATERRQVPAESSSKPAAGAGHSRTNSKSSAGSLRKVGFMSKLKGEFKVLSGKLKHDDKMVAEGVRMKQGQ
ncbi:unnamed protein product [Cutaneotrichosporon oleaginosum]